MQDILLNIQPKVLLIGNRAPELQQVLASTGINIVESISPVKGVHDVDRVMSEVSQYNFDLALVSAGIATSIICCRIAKQIGKIALKFGHLADELISGTAKWQLN